MCTSDIEITLSNFLLAFSYQTWRRALVVSCTMTKKIIEFLHSPSIYSSIRHVYPPLGKNRDVKEGRLTCHLSTRTRARLTDGSVVKTGQEIKVSLRRHEWQCALRCLKSVYYIMSWCVYIKANTAKLSPFLKNGKKLNFLAIVRRRSGKSRAYTAVGTRKEK